MDQEKSALPYLVCLGLGFLLGFGLTSSHYKDELLDQANAYKKSVQEAREQEQVWRSKANEIEREYQARIDDIKLSNAAVLNRLYKQLNEATSRVSSDSRASLSSHGQTREANVSKEIKKLVDFSNQCARRADELIIQVNSLQEWNKKVKQN